MDPAPSFAPLAAKLCAKAEEIRLADGAKAGLAGVMAWLMASLLLMLACLCEALDKRAALLAARALAAPRDAMASAILAPRAPRQAVPGERRAPRLTLLPQIQATTPDQAEVASGISQGPVPAGPRLAWPRDPAPIRAVLAPPWRPRWKTRLFHLGPCTPYSLRYRN